MKSNIKTSCADCQYDMFNSISNDVARAVIAVYLYDLSLKGYGKKRIQKTFDIFKNYMSGETLNFLGKTLRSDEMITLISNKFDVDFSQIKTVNETRQDFKRR